MAQDQLFVAEKIVILKDSFGLQRMNHSIMITGPGFSVSTVQFVKLK